MSEQGRYYCVACDQHYMGGAKAASGICELCGEAGTLRANGDTVVAVDDAAKGEPYRPTQEQIMRKVYQFAAKLVSDGMNASQVSQELASCGLSQATADKVADDVTRAHTSAARQDGRHNMLVGAAICLVGGLITAATISTAASQGGGVVVVAWGAILFGGIRCLKGLIRAIS